MPIQIIKSNNEIPSTPEWTDVPLADNSVIYEGRLYKVLSTKEEHISGLSYYSRVGLGIVVTLVSFGFALLSEWTRELFAKKRTWQFIAEHTTITKTFQNTLSPFSSETLPKDSEETFLKITDNWSFLDTLLQEYAKTLQSPPSTDKDLFYNFFRAELIQIQTEIDNLENQANEVLTALQNKKMSDLTHDNTIVSDLQQIHALQEKISALKGSCQKALNTMPKQESTIPVTGITNFGNACYMIASLQAFFAIDTLPEWMPTELTQNTGEDAAIFAKRQAIFASFKTLVEAKHTGASVWDLGKLVADLRITMFNEHLDEGGFHPSQGITSYQDAGSFFELLLYVIGKGVTVCHTRTFTNQEGVTSERTPEITPAGVLLLKDEGSIQHKLAAYSKETVETLNPHFFDYETTQIFETQKESFKVLGNPPEILVFRVNPYKIELDQDTNIDCTCLFSLPPVNANYTLTGLLRNHDQVHWTSLVCKNKEWFFCNDADTKKINTSDRQFATPCNYLVYKKT